MDSLDINIINHHIHMPPLTNDNENTNTEELDHHTHALLELYTCTY